MPRWAVAVALAAATSSYGHADAEGPARFQLGEAAATVLREGATIEKSAALGVTHAYAILLTAGDFLEITVSQDHVVVSLSLREPDGSVRRAVHVPNIAPLPQRQLIVARASGRHVFEIKVDDEPPSAHQRERRRYKDSDDSAPSQISYTLHVAALRPATDRDRVRVEWFGVLERAAAFVLLGNMEGLKQAIPVFHEAVAGWRAVGDDACEAATLEALATVAGFFTQFRVESAAARERLTELYARLGYRELQMINWSSLVAEYFDDGRLSDAKLAAARALELAVELNVRVVAARSQRDLGLYEFALGRYDRARELAQRAQELAAAIPDPTLEALAASDLSRLDDLAGDLESALTRNRRALDLASGNIVAAAPIMMWLGFNHLRRGELDEAAARFEERLAIRQWVQRDQEALARLGLGDVTRAKGERESARQRYEAAASALEKSRQSFRCIAEHRLGVMDLEDGRLDQARARFETMIQIAASVQDAQCEAEGRAGLADLAVRKGDLDTADREASQVVELTEAFREAAISLESRALGFGALAPAYERAIDISMRRAERGEAGAIARAIGLNEQALARGLLDRVLEGRLDARPRVPTALATERARVRDQWRARLAELQVAMRTRPDATKTKSLVDETRVLAVQVRDLEARIDAADLRHARFLGSRALGVDAIQALLGDDTLLLEYALGDARSYLWVVSASDIQPFTLPPRAVIEALARRVHEGLARSPAAKAKWSVDQEDRRALSRLLIQPAVSLLAGKRLVVVLPGALSLVPFGALPQPGGGQDSPLMIARHEITQIPSATILAAMRSLTAGRARPGKTLAIFADPIFDASDPRLRSASTSPRRDRTPSPSAALRLPGLSLTRLPFSRSEAETIAALAPASVSMFLGLDATRERALERALADYRFIHFATHGVVNQDVPSLSSLILSLVDRTGRPRDGLVMLPDIYDMTLNADVVVLSGCQTALGKQVRGEGPIGLARAFMYAGVPRVVASLWQVDDLATAELMKRFYRGMLVDEMTPAAALRAAQRELATSRRWASPYFWGPFVLQGDWR